jgi:hypothetical protein
MARPRQFYCAAYWHAYRPPSICRHRHLVYSIAIHRVLCTHRSARTPVCSDVCRQCEVRCSSPTWLTVGGDGKVTLASGHALSDDILQRSALLSDLRQTSGPCSLRVDDAAFARWMELAAAAAKGEAAADVTTAAEVEQAIEDWEVRSLSCIWCRAV